MAASQIKIQSFNQFLGAMIRAIIANTPLSDVNQGSVLLTILEAAAANDFENSTAILSLLNLLNIDIVSNTDLDNRAADLGLTRQSTVRSSGNVTFFNNGITKQSTSLYVIKPAPVAGQTVLFVNNTTDWASSGTLYIGRGTNSFEGPITYSSITVFPTFSQINLSSALQNNHLMSDTVINSQGQPDRVIAAGTMVSIPANNQNPEIDFITLRDAVLLAGETQVENVPANALIAGSIGNAPINTIIQFQTIPFTSAAVSNASAFTGGTDVETDQELRNRIKSYINTLARGTGAAILAAVYGVSDSSDSKQVASAVIAEPPSVGEPAILYIDDGHGFQPSYAGQSVDTLLTNATGKEKFLQLANYPVARPQVVNVGIGPFSIVDQSFLNVSVDGEEETIIFRTTDFVNISAAQVAEIVVAINSQSINFSARLTNNSNNILLYPKAFDAEIIQVVPQQPLDVPSLYVNSLLQFPVSEFSFISLYQNNDILREKSITAHVESAPFASWNVISAEDLIISVDNTPEQDRTFNLSSFPGASTFASLTLADWVRAFNSQFAGITAIATANQTMKINSNQSGASSALNVSGGTLLAKMFPTQPTTSTGQTGQFVLNRQTGNLEILSLINKGDNITAGAPDTKGFVVSTSSTTGIYDVSSDGAGRASQMVIVADSTYCDQRAVNAIIGSTITITNPSANIMRIASSLLDTFAALLPGDFIYITQRSTAWLSATNTGLFKIIDKGSNVVGTDIYIDVMNPTSNIVPEGPLFVADSADIQAFSTDGYPQVWFGTFTPNPPLATISDIVSSINSELINVIASVYQSNSIKITSTTENNGSIAIPVTIGNATTLFISTEAAQFGNPSQVASIISKKSLLTHFKIDMPTKVDTWLNRHVFNESKGIISANSIPDVFPWSGPYSEILQSTGVLNLSHVDFFSILNFTRGNNRDQLRSIAAFLPSDEVGTQEALARTSLNHVIGDEIEIVRPLQLSASDTIVVVIDGDPQNNTISIPMARTGQVNSGSNALSFLPTTTEFSANDYDNQTGIDFSSPNVWSTSLNNTDFSDYAVWFRARNWYSSGGVGGGNGVMILRADEYGPNGNFLRFSMQYPTIPNQVATTSFSNTPSFSTLSYFFSSGAGRAIAQTAGNTISVKGPYPDTATNFPNGVISSGNYFDYTFSAGSLAPVVVGDVLSIILGSGVSTANQGQFKVQAISGNTVRVFNPSGVATIPGAPAVYTVTTVADIAGSLNGTYFVVNDTNGSVVIWIQEGSAVPPVVPGAGRYIMVNAPFVSSALGTASYFAILASSAITNTGSSVITGDVGVTPAGAITPGAWTVIGTIHTNDATAATANSDATTAFSAMQTLGLAGTTIPSALDGQILTPGAYKFASGAATLAQSGSGTFTLSGAGTFIIYTASTLTTGAGGMPTITLTGGALASNVFFIVGSTATINVGTAGVFNGNIIAQTSITNTMGGTVNGSLIALTGAVTLSAAAVINAQASPALTAPVIASDIVTALTGDIALTASAIGNVVTISNIQNGLLPSGSAGTSGFGVTTFAPGIDTALETISNPANVNAFPITGTSVGSISTTINTSKLMSATPVGNPALTITVATQEETSATLAYGYTPGNSYVSMYDGVNWVKSFENPNPNFTFKTAFALQGAAPSVYSMDTTPNFDIVTNGELFKLIPTTIQNLYHQLTQKALSQLPIVAMINITDDRKNVQIKSKNLGSAGAIEFIGGTGNQSKMYVQLESEVDTDGSGSYLVVKVPAFPDTFSAGDTVLLQNDMGVERLNRLQASDTMDVLSPSAGKFDYTYNPKVTGIASATSFTIADVSASYGIPAGFVWRWTATGIGITFSDVNPGDLIYAFGSLTSGWDQNNLAKPTGDAAVSGLPIVTVNVASNWVDVVNPFGKTMSATTVGSGTVQICPTPVIQWTLAHVANINFTSLSRTIGTVSAITATPHFLSTGDSVTIRNSINIPDATYSGITVTSPNQFTFTLAGPNFLTENPISASMIKSSLTQTRYRLQSLGFNGLMRLSRQDGESPNFVNCGVAVDDYIVFNGTTFKSNNNGRFRVLAVDNNSIVFLNPLGTDELNTVRTMNDQGFEVAFTANTNYITGPVGSFKNIQVGDWVKKETDSDAVFLQVLSLNNTADLATQINLSGNYAGSTNTSVGTIYRESTDYDKGVFLKSASDISIYEGDAVVEGDTLFIQNIVDANWFNINNVGSYPIIEYGTKGSSYRPFIRVANAGGITQAGAQIVVNTGGFYVIEGLANKFYTIREVAHTVLDDVSSDLRSVYITSSSRSYKFTPANFSSITHLGKLGYDNVAVIGIDGYTYYTGLLQKVQRIVDGYEPNATDFGGMRAVGSSIETLPPLPFQINLALNVVTNAGVNLGDVSNNVKSAIINYVEGLAVGAPVVLSQIIANIQPIKGVASVTFTYPIPSTQSITLKSNEKAIITANNISIA